MLNVHSAVWDYSVVPPVATWLQRWLFSYACMFEGLRYCWHPYWNIFFPNQCCVSAQAERLRGCFLSFLDFEMCRAFLKAPILVLSEWYLDVFTLKTKEALTVIQWDYLIVLQNVSITWFKFCSEPLCFAVGLVWQEILHLRYKIKLINVTKPLSAENWPWLQCEIPANISTSLLVETKIGTHQLKAWWTWLWTKGHQHQLHGAHLINSHPASPNINRRWLLLLLPGPKRLRLLGLAVARSLCTGSFTAFDDLMCLYPKDRTGYSWFSVTTSDPFKTHLALFFTHFLSTLLA